MRTSLCLALLAACAGSEQGMLDNRGWSEHMTAANAHEQRAAEHEVPASETSVAPGGELYACGDSVLNDQLTTGGFRHTNWVPCWNVEEEAMAHERFLAEHERRAARRERQAAAGLAQAEAAACTGIPEREREHSPFVHTREIADVIPHRETGELRGLWVVFKPVPALNASWLQRDIACFRAHWKLLGEDPTLAPNDPTLIPGAQYQVFDRGDHVEVLVLTTNPTDAELALARTRGALAPGAQTAVR